MSREEKITKKYEKMLERANLEMSKHEDNPMLKRKHRRQVEKIERDYSEYLEKHPKV